jgi:hypothetical protein
MPINHSKVLSGSRAEQRINCPGSYALEVKVNAPDEGSDFAREGSMLHACMELILTSELRGEALFELEGQTMGEEFKDIPVTRTHIVDKLIPATETFWELVEKYRIDDWFLEANVSLDAVIPQSHGTCDVLGKDTSNLLWVIDWKFGDGIPVTAEGNYQLGFYAGAALYDQDEEIEAFCRDVTGVVLVIIQPRVGANTALDMWPTTIDWVEDLVELAVEAVKQAQLPNAPYKIGSHCRWCTGRPICPAHHEVVAEVLDVDPQAATSVELATLLRQAGIVGVWANSVFELAQRELEAGAQIPGWKLVQKQPRRRWVDEEKAVKRMTRRYGVKTAYTRELLSPAQAEKLDKAFYAKSLSDCVESKSSGLTIVEDSDKRPAVVNSMALLANALKASLENTGASKDE